MPISGVLAIDIDMVRDAIPRILDSHPGSTKMTLSLQMTSGSKA
jgi:hypothetical protein